jgi:hypothetical protein
VLLSAASAGTSLMIASDQLEGGPPPHTRRPLKRRINLHWSAWAGRFASEASRAAQLIPAAGSDAPPGGEGVVRIP